MLKRTAAVSLLSWLATDWRSRSLLAVALAAFAVFGHTRDTRATGEQLQYTVYTGLDLGSLWQYGAHFDEGANGYLARDFNAPSGESTAYAQLRIYVSAYQPSGVAFKFTHLSTNCAVNAQAGYINGSGAFVAYAGESVHFLHLKSATRIANNTVTSPLYQGGWSWPPDVAQLDTCGTSYLHLHHSADIGPTTPYYRWLANGNETCWVEALSYQCPGTYRVHLNDTAWSGYGGVSGNYDQYLGEEWSWESWSATYPLVEAKW